MQTGFTLLQAGRGSKRVCQDCAARFYDLGRTPVICPKCGTEYREAPPALPTRKKGRGVDWPSLAQTDTETPAPDNTPDETEEAGDDAELGLEDDEEMPSAADDTDGDDAKDE